MKTSSFAAVILLVACNSTPVRKDFTKISVDMDSATVLKLVGEPSDKNHFDAFGAKVSMWVYKNDTAMVSFANGKVSKVMAGNDLKESMKEIGQGLEELKPLMENENK